MRQKKEKALAYIRQYQRVIENEKIIREQMFAIDRLMSASRVTTLSSVPTKGGASRYEDFVVNQIAKKDELKIRLAALMGQKSVFRMILESLPKRERIVIERFYISGARKGAVDDLTVLLGFEKSHIYRIKDSALCRISDIIDAFEDDSCPSLTELHR